MAGLVYAGDGIPVGSRDSTNLHDGRWDHAVHPKGRNRRTVWEIPLPKFAEAQFAVFTERFGELCIIADLW